MPVFVSFLANTAKQVMASKDRLSDLADTITEINRAEDELRILIEGFKTNVRNVY